MIDLIEIGFGGEIDGFGDGGVAVVLEGGLHANVPFGSDVVGTDENAFDVVGDIVEVSEGAGLGDAADEVVVIETM